jgi:hypothetical protein
MTTRRSHTRAQARRLRRRALLLILAGPGLIVAGPGLIVVANMAPLPSGAVTRPALLLIVPALTATGLRQLQNARRWSIGARGELVVARRLRPLERRGWLILHDLPRPGAGNIDHIAAGPRGLFTIETKLTRHGPAECAQAHAHARWLAQTTGQPVAPILCLVNRNPRAHHQHGVAIIGARRLRRHLQHHRGLPAASVRKIRPLIGLAGNPFFQGGSSARVQRDASGLAETRPPRIT